MAWVRSVFARLPPIVGEVPLGTTALMAVPRLFGCGLRLVETGASAEAKSRAAMGGTTMVAELMDVFVHRMAHAGPLQQPLYSSCSVARLLALVYLCGLNYYVAGS